MNQSDYLTSIKMKNLLKDTGEGGLSNFKSILTSEDLDIAKRASGY